MMKERYTALYKTHYDELCHYVNTRVCCKAETEDIVQDTFLLAWVKFESLQSHPNQVGWLKRVAKNKIYEYIRNYRKTDYRTIRPEEVKSDEKDYIWKEAEMMVAQSFSFKEREWFEDYFMQGVPEEQLARSEQVSENNMRVRLCRLRTKFISLLH